MALLGGFPPSPAMSLARLFKRIQSICENPGPSLIFFDFERPEPVDELLEETPAERGNLLVPLTVTLILFEELVDREAMAQRERERGQRGRRERVGESSMAKRARDFFRILVKFARTVPILKLFAFHQYQNMTICEKIAIF